MITIKFTFRPSSKELYLLNKPFTIQDVFENHGRSLGRISSYHDPREDKANWFKYYNLGSPLEVIIAEAETSLSQDEMLMFMAQNNGFAMSRDNLFALLDIYEDPLNKYAEAKKRISIIAPANESLLPAHKNGPRICPMLEIEYKGPIENPSVDYDWSWINDPGMPITNFAFFRHIVNTQNY